MNQWKFSVDASILAVGLLIKAGAPLVPIVIGLAAAAIVMSKTERSTNRLHR